MFRSPTTRANIRYEVRNLDAVLDAASDEAVDSAVHDIVLEYRCTAPKGRTIVYCNTVARTKRLARCLVYPVYHNKAEGKDAILEDFLSNRQDIIVAINSLGLGIDAIGVLLVVY